MMTFQINILDQQKPQSTQHSVEELQFTKFMLDRAADAAFWVGSNAQFVYVNNAACRSLEYSRTELLSMTTHDINPNMPQNLWLKHWQALKQQGMLIFESCHQTKGGQIFSVEISATYVEFQGRGYSCAFARDITQRKQTEEVALQKTHTAAAVVQLEEPTLRQCSSTEDQQALTLPTADIPKPITPRSIFPSNHQLSQIFDFIEANYHQSIGLREVAQKVGYSAAYLTDLVRRQTGQTVHHWIIVRRMAAARSLLLETTQTVNQIAEATGYQNEGHFFRQFRQHHGTTPQAWRNARCI